MHFERRNQPVLNRTQWWARVRRSLAYAGVMVGVALSIGVIGYHFLGALPWVDALLEASMILSGMGPVADMQNDAVKIFASFYALFSGLVVIGTTGLLLAPWLHRLMHHFHAASRE